MSASETGGGAYRRIAVPLDGTAESEHALRWAITIARRAACPLDLVHVSTHILPPPEPFGASVADERIVGQDRGAALERLRRLAGEIERRDVRAGATVLDGTVPTALADHFARTEPDLIVMTTHDRGRLEHLLVGSVAESVTRRAHIPVLLVRPVAAAASLEPDVEIRHILIPLDGSPFAGQIVPRAATLAGLMRADITLIAVLQPVLAVASAALGAGPDPVMPLSKAPGGEETKTTVPELEAVAASLTRESRVPVHTAALSSGQPARAIVGYASDHQIDLIAMTTHGRGALKRLVAGSVSEAVLRTSHLPMLMFRPTMT